MKSILFSFFVLNVVLIFSAAVQLDVANSQDHQQRIKFDPTRDAQNDIQKAIVLAEKSKKRILLDVGGEWCVWCHRLDSLFIQNKDLEDYLTKYYVVVKVNVSKENENKQVLSKYPKVPGYPHLFVLNEKGKLLHSQNTGELEFPDAHPVKGHDKEKVFTFLKQWTGK